MGYQFTSPISMPRGTHYGSDYWIAYSHKLCRQVHLFSMLEYANFVTLEMNPEVEYYCEQPLKIEESNQKSVFDFYVYYKDKSEEFQEVKYANELVDDTNAALRSQRQISLQKDWCEKHNYAYRIVTEKDIYKGEFYFDNLKHLYSILLRSSYENLNELFPNLSRLLEMHGNMSIGAIMEAQILPTKNVLEFLAYHHQRGNISVNLTDGPLNKNTEVKLCELKNIV